MTAPNPTAAKIWGINKDRKFVANAVINSEIDHNNVAIINNFLREILVDNNDQKSEENAPTAKNIDTINKTWAWVTSAKDASISTAIGDNILKRADVKNTNKSSILKELDLLIMNNYTYQYL